jgi:hypothetical protein
MYEPILFLLDLTTSLTNISFSLISFFSPFCSNLLNSLCHAIHSYKIENALQDHLHAYDLIIQDEANCFRSNDFARIQHFDELMKCFKTDYQHDIESESSLDNFSVSSHLNPDIVNYLDHLDDVIGKAFKFHEPEELFQTTSSSNLTGTKKKTQKIKKVGKGTTIVSGGRKGKKGELNGEDDLEDGAAGDQPLDGDGNEILSGKKVIYFPPYFLFLLSFLSLFIFLDSVS